MTGGRTVFLTGGTGFIGSGVAAALAARGDTLRCLVRSPKRARPLEELGADIIAGEITDSIALARGLDGADLAIHLAAIYAIGPGNVREMERINVSGTRCLLEEAARAGTPRIVHVSSTAALGPRDAERDTPADAWRGPFPSAYHRTKALAHDVARQAHARGLPVLTVCPGYVYGPRDTGPNEPFMRDLLRGRLPALLNRPAKFSFVYVEDVVRGLIAAADRGEPGGNYVLGGEDATMNEFAERVVALAEKRPPPLRLPVWMVSATGAALDVLSVITRKRFTISRESVAASARYDWTCDYDDTSQALDWAPRPLAEGLPPTVRWFLDNL